MIDLVVLTNFSTAADRALEYAALLASKLPGRVHLLHIWQHSLLDANYFVEVPPFSTYFDRFPVSSREDHEQALLLRQEAFGKDLAIETHFILGSMDDKLPPFLRQLGNPLLVTGKCDTENLPDEMVDSVSLHLLNSGRLPLLIVPQRLGAVSLPKHVVLASDEKDFSVEGSPLLSILEQLQPLLTIVEVTPSVDQARQDRLRQLAETKFDTAGKASIHLIERENVAKGIRKYCSDAGADLLVMVHRRHSFLDRLFHETVIAEFVRHPKIPLLVLPE